jgi:AcrR family transcriptional regulator
MRAKLIDAAIAQFARTGIRASSLRAVAEAAGVTPAMLHYYFGNKRQMTLAVIEERLLPALAPLRSTIEDAGGTPAELVHAFVDGIGAMIAAHPWLPSLWVREVLSEGGALRDTLLKQVFPQLPQLLVRRFEAAQAQGQLAADLDPRLLVVSLVGLTLFPAAGAPIWRQALDARDLDAEALRRHTLALLDHGVAASRVIRGRRRP